MKKKNDFAPMYFRRRNWHISSFNKKYFKKHKVKCISVKLSEIQKELDKLL